MYYCLHLLHISPRRTGYVRDMERNPNSRRIAELNIEIERGHAAATTLIKQATNLFTAVTTILPKRGFVRL